MTAPLPLFTGPGMAGAWVTGSIVAVIAGLVGFFVVARGSAFAAHAIPQCGFAGAAGASLIGLSTALGLGAFCVAAALGMSWLGRRGRHDVAIALTLVVMLGMGALFLSLSQEYAPEAYSLLFGEILGVSSAGMLDTAILGVLCAAAVAVLYRPLLASSVMGEAASGRGAPSQRLGLAFLVLVGLASSITVPVVGALLCFSLMIAPAAAARFLTSNPLLAMGLGATIALATVWLAIAAAYLTGWPVGFFVAVIAALCYGLGRLRARLAARQGRLRGGLAAAVD